MFFEDKKELHLLREILEELKKIKYLLSRPVRGEIIFGDDCMSAAAVVLNLGQSVPAKFVQFNADGSVFTGNPADVVWSVQDGTIVDVSNVQPDGSVIVKSVAAGTTNIGAADKTTGISAVGSVTVNTPPPPPGPVSGQIQFGTPTP